MDNKAQWSLVAAAWVLAIGVISIGVYAVRHFGHPGGPPALPGSIQAFGTPARPLCPVDRVEVVPVTGTASVNYRGNTYYFCDNKDPMGRSHRTVFLMDPLLYLTGVSGMTPPSPPSVSLPAAAAATPTATPAPAS